MGRCHAQRIRYYSHFHQQLAFAHSLSAQELDNLFATYATKTQTLLAIARELQVRFARAQPSNLEDPTAQRRMILWQAIFEQRIKVYELELAWLQQTRDQLFLPTNPQGTKPV